MSCSKDTVLPLEVGAGAADVVVTGAAVAEPLPSELLAEEPAVSVLAGLDAAGCIVVSLG